MIWFDINHAHKNLIAMPLIMYIHNGQSHKKGYNIKVNEKVEAGCEEPVGDIRGRSRANGNFRGDRGGSRGRVADMHTAYNNERKMTWKE